MYHHHHRKLIIKGLPLSFFFFNAKTLKKYIYYIWLHRVFVAAHGLSLVVVLGLLISVTSLVAYVL